MNRAYAFLTVKSVEDEQRIIRGIATTPEPDRLGDIVEPLGIAFKNPLPLLHQHDARSPVGHVIFKTPTAAGIEFEARIPRVSEPPSLKERVDVAWAEVKAGLVRAVSIGFRPLDGAVERLKEGGVRFIKSEVLELSLVTIPAHAGATISEIRSIDTALLAASGREQDGDRRLTPPGVSGSLKTVRMKGTTMPKTIAEQISGFEATRVAKAARMEELMNASGEKGETLDAEQTEEYDGLEAELKSIDAHLVRLAALERATAAKAKPVVEVKNIQEGGDQRGGVAIVSAMKDNLPAGIEFARYAMCLATARGDPNGALEVAKTRYPDQQRIQTVLKAAVAAGTTTDATWAGALVDYTHFAGDFIEFLRADTVIGKFGANGIPSLRRVPFNIQIPRQTGAHSANWVGEGAPKPVSAGAFDNVTLRWAKIAGISVLTQEVVRFSSPSAETLVRDSLAAAVIERMDRDFVDPAKAAVSNVSPASITNGITPVASSGTDETALRNDIRALMQSFIDGNLKSSRGVFIMSESNALGASLMTNPLGQASFPNVNAAGGSLLGRPVITSQYLGGIVIYMIPEEIFLADDGQVVIDASREASLQMDSAPTNNSATPTATTVVSMFQTNSIAIRAERFINWLRRRDSAVAWLDDVDWGTSSGSDA